MESDEKWILCEDAAKKYGLTSDQIYLAIKKGLVDWKPVVGPTMISIEDLEENLEDIKNLPRKLPKKQP